MHPTLQFPLNATIAAFVFIHLYQWASLPRIDHGLQLDYHFRRSLPEYLIHGTAEHFASSRSQHFTSPVFQSWVVRCVLQCFLHLVDCPTWGIDLHASEPSSRTWFHELYPGHLGGDFCYHQHYLDVFWPDCI